MVLLEKLITKKDELVAKGKKCDTGDAVDLPQLLPWLDILDAGEFNQCWTLMGGCMADIEDELESTGT